MTILGRGFVPAGGSRLVCLFVLLISSMLAVTSTAFHPVCTGRPLLKVILSEVEAERPVGNAEIENARIVASTTSPQYVLVARRMNMGLRTAVR